MRYTNPRLLYVTLRSPYVDIMWLRQLVDLHTLTLLS